MKLSIITINYNNAEGLLKTIESVITQTFNDYEYIIIDGGSRDGSVDIIKQYDNQIDYWISEPDKGIYNAMNKGVLKANGDYLYFLNSGDCLVANDTISNIFNNLTDCDLVYGNAILEYENNVHIIQKHQNMGENLTFHSFYKGGINHQSAFINKRLFNKYGLYDENLKLVSDWKFFLVAFGLNTSKAIYKDINICYFDMQGLGSNQDELLLKERNDVIKDLVPQPIIKDYENFLIDIEKINFIKKHWFTRIVFLIVEKLLIRISMLLNKK